MDDGVAAEAFFGGQDPTPHTPLGAAFMWWNALLNLPAYRVALENLSVEPAVWGDYAPAVVELNDWALMQNIVECEDAPGEIAYAKFMPDTGVSMRAFGVAQIPDYRVLTLARCEDGWWRVWGLTSNWFPPASEVRGEA